MLWHSDECVLLPCFNAQPDIFAVMNCCIVALSVFTSDILTWSADILVYIQCQGRTQGGGWINLPYWAWYFTKTLLPAQSRLNNIIMIFYCGLMVHITDTRTQKVVSYTSAHITATVLAHNQHWEEHSSLSSPQLYRHSQKHRKWITIQ